MELRPYQLRCLTSSEKAIQQGVTRQLWVLATGLGKTVLAASFFARRGLQGTLGIMHREELLNQSAEKILAVSPEARVGLEKAEHRAPASSEVILASVQTVGRKSSTRLPAPSWLRTLWIDECHHAAASGYLEVGLDRHDRNPGTP